MIISLILSMDWWLRALILAVPLIIGIVMTQGEYMPVIVMTLIMTAIIFVATSLTKEDPGKLSLCGDFFGLYLYHKLLYQDWWLLYFIGLFLLIVLI